MPHWCVRRVIKLPPRACSLGCIPVGGCSEITAADNPSVVQDLGLAHMAATYHHTVCVMKSLNWLDVA